MADYTNAQFDRLPKWAKIEMQRLQRNLKFHQEEHLRIATGGILEKDTNTLVDPYADIPQMLEANSTVAFRLGEDWRHGVVRVRISRDGTLNVNGDHGLLIRPNSSNDIQIGLEGS